MDRQRPSGVLPRSPFRSRFHAKLALGFLFLILLSGYQPAFQFPPVKKNIIYAQESQTKTVESESISLVFQAPHPGYISTHFSSYHPGIDLATGLGMPIKPIAHGKVTYAGYTFFGLGLMVEVDHGEGYRSVYGHMGATYVKEGQEVSENDYLGEVGLTGHTSGPHTHLEVYKDGKAIDPLTILPAQREQPQESDFVAQGGKVNLSPIIQATPTPIVVPTPTPAPSPKIVTTEIKQPSLTLAITPTPTPSPIKPNASLKNILSLLPTH